MISVIEAVCSRPKMFTQSGSPKEVAAFLEGYFTSLHEPIGVDTPERCRRFCDWVKRHLGGDQREPWFRIWPASQEPVETEKLLGLYRRFLVEER